MARGKYPEESRKKILEVAERLFLEKGYDNTSIQDIIDGLGGMTKGVIYHHFKSKFDIFETLMTSTSKEILFEEWEGENGLKKLQNSLHSSFTNYKRQAIAYSAAVMLKSPRMLGEQYLNIFQNIVPKIHEIVEEGVKDGSIQTEFPKEIADLIMLTFNLWVGFQIALLSENDLKRKMCFIKKTFDSLGVPLIDDNLLDETFKLFAFLKKDSI